MQEAFLIYIRSRYKISNKPNEHYINNNSSNNYHQSRK